MLLLQAATPRSYLLRMHMRSFYCRVQFFLFYLSVLFYRFVFEVLSLFILVENLLPLELGLPRGIIGLLASIQIMLVLFVEV